MAITSIGSYEETTEEFDLNWEEANREMAPEVIRLAGDYALANFQTDREALIGLINRVPDLAEDARFASADYGNAKVNLMTRAKQLRGAILSKITDKTYLGALVPIPDFSADFSKFVKPLNSLLSLWSRINAHLPQLGLSAEIALQPDYPSDEFGDEILALSALNNAQMRADSDVGFARNQRNAAMDAIYERMKQYRQGAESALPPGSDALSELPRLTPKAGTTPPPLEVSGAWNPATLMADLGWSASEAKEVAKIQIRGCVKPNYQSNEEEVVTDLPPTATSWSGDWGLMAPGSDASFKAYVITKSGNENGGEAVVIVRPAPSSP